MSFVELCVRYVYSMIITIMAGIGVCLVIFIKILKNPFKNHWPQKLKLEPPANLSNPKYGVHKYMKVNNIKLHYVESGDPSKPLMLYIHGFPELWYSWRHQIVEFNKEYRVVAVDMRGYGDSEKPEDVSSYKIDYLVEDIRDLICKLGYDKCILVSHDWGGIIACRFREKYPEVLHALIMMASTSLDVFRQVIFTSKNQLRKSWYTFLYRLPKLPELFMQMNDLESINRIMLVKGKYTINEQDIECYKYWFRKQNGLTPPINYYRANLGYTWETKFYEESVPFLLAYGANDKYLSKSIQDEMKLRYATIEVTTVENCGHFMQQEEPEKVNKIMHDFLKKYNL